MASKLFMALMIVCLAANVLAFVKRDAPAPQPNYLEQLQKQLVDIGTTLNNTMSSVFNSEQIKDNFQKGVQNIQKAINDFTQKSEKSEPPK